MSNVTPFEFEGQNIRIIDRDGEPWWALVDVCRGTGHSNPSMAAKILDDDEKYTLSLAEGVEKVAGTGVQQLMIISEPGLYKLLARSDKPEAKRFDRWNRHEVLPPIRKTGS
jgi:anti-repressor protein